MHLLLLSFVACSLSAWAADNPFLGTWKIDLTRSKGSPASGLPPDSLTVTIQPEGEDGVKISEDYIGKTTNKPFHVARTCKFDGKEYPVTGWTRPAGTEAIKRVDTHTWEVTRKSEAKVVDQHRWVVSTDGNTLIWTGTGTNRASGKYENSVVFTRR
jgi:hypothetical protein